ncbi:MAG: DEAD/DEAH box helicase [Candidatus Bathyarchaeia archaeon]|jgi:ATP-dependent Lhr-like helicase|nr:DEAD/DEAH box helicase [Candidatus Bathyarchaeota archaeon A05DMB-4]MDH7595508.1 DEAD/DEAH box helicase [Candidatus Bathyarchaeota archaeon]
MGTSASSVFELLAKPLQKTLSEFGFSEPTAPQVKAIPLILAGENVLLVAPTGSGKTEAVFLPVFSSFLQQKEKKGIAIVYVTPLRALNRDLVRRLSSWAEHLSMSIEVRHGDTEIKIRRRQALRPPNMLVTTPETLQAILPGSRMREHLSNVRYVIIDEVHQLAEDKRGTQLTIALERLFEITGKEFQRIGLSATVGKTDEMAQFIAGTNRPIKVVVVPLPKSFHYNVVFPVPEDADYDLAGKWRTAPEAAARVRYILDLVKSHESTLIFVNSRTNAEILGSKLNQLTTDIAVHHGSLSKEERAFIEDEFKAGRLKGIVCTSTLELGIDIGTVDLVVQYLSPRQVCNLIQRVGRSGHRLGLVSKGIIITAFFDDILESIAAVKRAYKSLLEPIQIHKGALDVLAHQIAGILMDKRKATVDQVLQIVQRAYPYQNLSKAKLLDVANYLDILGELEIEGDTLRKTRKTRTYYYENLSMIPDEKRYPIIDVLSDRSIGTLGDEFMALRARIGLNFICKGKIWRIVQIEDETGTVYVIPSEDPYAAIPGWDGEMLPVPFDLAQETGRLRKEIAEFLQKEASVEKTTEILAKKLSVDNNAMRKAIEEIDEHLKQNVPLPTHESILIEGFDKYLVIHACFGEIVNRTLGSIFDAVLSDQELIVGWWNDGYRILVEMPSKVSRENLEKISNVLFRLSDEEVDKAFNEYLKARFPFGYKMKFVAERFGALPRGKTMGPERQEELARRFEKTPVYEETLREALQEKVDLSTVKHIMHEIKEGKIKIARLLCLEKPSPIAYGILEKFLQTPELMAPEKVLLSNIERMKKTINLRITTLLCLSCGDWTKEKRIRELSEKPVCEKCGSGLLAQVRLDQNPKTLMEILKRRQKGAELTSEELEHLSYARRTADLTLSYGKKALIALQVKGVGPETAFRILGKMHSNEDDFYMDLLKAKIQYLRTKPYWENQKKPVQG